MRCNIEDKVIHMSYVNTFVYQYRWNMWRTMSDLYLIRGAIESHIHAHEDDTQETSGRPSSDEGSISVWRVFISRCMVSIT